MRYRLIFGLCAVLLTTSLLGTSAAYGQSNSASPSEQALAALALAKAQRERAAIETDTAHAMAQATAMLAKEKRDRVKPRLTYAEAHAVASFTGQRLAVFVGTPAREIAGVVCVSVPHDGAYAHHREGSIVVSSNFRTLGNLYVVHVACEDADDEEIRSAGKTEVTIRAELTQSQLAQSGANAQRQEVSRTAAPFGSRSFK